MTRSRPDSFRPRSDRNAAVGRFELRDLELNRGAQRYGAGRRPSQERSESRLLRCVRRFADRRQICLIDIDHQKERLRRQQLKPAQAFEVAAGN